MVVTRALHGSERVASLERVSTRFVRCAAAVLSMFLASTALGCVVPRQSGEILVLPGATERLLIAMRMGYAGAGEATAPARLERAVLDEQLPAGPAAAGRLGDWVLENDRVIAVVTRVDGTLRGGRLVDLTGGDAAHDGLEGFELRIAGHAVRYDAASTGRDDTTGAVYVEVSGRVEGLPGVAVSTRYDVAPALPAVVVHTQVRGLGLELRETPGWISDRLRFTGAGRLELGSAPSGTATSELAPGHAAWLADRASYVLRPLSESPLWIEPNAEASDRASVGLASAVTDEPLLYSRIVAPLADPSPEGLAAALERLEGREAPALPIEPEFD
jgi:hypothetical protein